MSTSTHRNVETLKALYESYKRANSPVITDDNSEKKETVSITPLLPEDVSFIAALQNGYIPRVR